jgi:hypothetical protein
MNTAAIVEQIDAEIERLKKVKALTTVEAAPVRRGRAPGSGKSPKANKA